MKKKEKTKTRAEVSDITIGNNLKRFRKMRGLSMMELATHLDISFQQIQKYEKGLNKVSASCLLRLSIILGVSPIDFFSGMLPTQKIMDTDRDTNLLFKYFAKIKNPNDRSLVVQIAKKLSSS